MNTSFSEIVNVNYIGEHENPILMNDLLGSKATQEKMQPSNRDRERVLFLGIDIQKDFMDNGALGVPGACKDVERICQFIYDHMEQITNIAVSIDTHLPFQIFHPCWWVDENGNHPAPFTQITLKDLDDGKWKAVIDPIKSRDYVLNLESSAKKNLTIWTYHCIQGTDGCSLENQFSNMIFFHSVARKSTVLPLVKGRDPLSEMYGIIKPEYDTKGFMNTDFLNKLETYDKIIIAGEAKSHCVNESIRQILENYAQSPEITRKIYILEDCMSCIPGSEADTEKAFEQYKSIYGVNIVNSTDNIF